MNYREWSGYYAVSVYEMHHDHEYNAIRNACALIDVTPLYKYRIEGKDATKFVNRVITRSIPTTRDNSCSRTISKFYREPGDHAGH
jgi:glycine cleavage system aminomethyltransferase T